MTCHQAVLSPGWARKEAITGMSIRIKAPLLFWLGSWGQRVQCSDFCKLLVRRALGITLGEEA